MVIFVSQSSTTDYLDRILSQNKKQYSTLNKQNFISRFSIVFTRNYIDKLIELISKIKLVYSCNEDTALIHYSCFMQHVMNKVVMNNTSNYEARKCSRKEFDRLVEQSKDSIVNDHLEQIVGKTKYYSLLKNKLHFTGTPNNTEKIFVIEIDEHNNLDDMLIISQQLSEKFFIIKRCAKGSRVDSPVPYIYFRGASACQLSALKNCLYTNDYPLVDGYPFLGSNFQVDHMTQDTSTKKRFKLRVINDDLCLEQIIKKLNGKIIELFELYRREELVKITGERVYVKHIKISEVSDIINYLLK